MEIITIVFFKNFKPGKDIGNISTSLDVKNMILTSATAWMQKVD
jgi:hypothetical protein